MSAKTPLRVVFDGSNNATGLAEFQSGEFIALSAGGLGASLSIGSAGQVLKVNSGASALEFGNVEAVFNIDGMTDGTSITLADGDVFAISDGGTEKRITASQIKTYVSGTGGTAITALDLDGATDIGAALADADLFIVDDGAGGTNRKMAASRIKTYVADITLTTAAQTNITSLGTLTSLTVDDITIDGSTISDSGSMNITSGSSLTVDVDGAIRLDAGSGGNGIQIRDDGTEIVRIHNSSSDVILETKVQDKDLFIKGNDGGSTITALSFDMSAAGAATFNDNVTVGGDLIVNGTTTTVNSTTVTVDDPIFTLGGDSAPGSDDNKDRGIEFRYHTGSAAKVGFFGYDDSASAFTFIADATNSSEVFSGSAGDVVFGNISIGDSNKVNIGAGNDLQLYHDGSDSFIDDAGTGDLKIRSSFTRIIDMSNSHVAATFASSGVNLRHANSVKLTTTSAGATVTGVLTADGVTLGANESVVFGDAGETITGDGTNLSIVSSNSLGIDTANGITLDSGSGGAILKAGGSTTYGTLTSSSGDFSINQTTSDKDIIFTGNDGGSTIEAMRIDMSEGGRIGIGTSTPARDLQIAKSTSGGTVRLEVNNESNTGSSHGVISIYSGGTSGGDPYLHFKVDNGEQYSIGIDNDQSDALVFSNGFGVGSNNLLSIATDGAATFNSTVTANAGVIVDNITIDGTEIDLSSGDLTIDVAGKTVIDSDDGGTLQLVDGGTSYLKLFEFSNYAALESMISDNDFKIRGNDGGSFIDALTFDMSAAGAAAFNSTITADGGKDVILGKNQGTNFTNSLLIGHATTGTLDSAENNLGVGISALDAITSGDSNVALGTSAGSALTTGALNVFIGTSAGAGATDPQGNIAIGAAALGNADPGNNNIAIGESAGKLITGVRNLVIGENAGDNITSGSGNVIIGSAVDADSATGNRQLKIAGNSGGSTTTWISGDDTGALTFADKVILGANKEIQFVDTNESIKSDGSKLIIKSGGTTFNFPTADGSDGQALVTDGSGTFSFADAGSSGFSSSTITTTPGAVDFDLSKTNNAGSAETPFDTTATDAFGSAVGSVFDCMEPIGGSAANNVDLGSSESHVGA